MSTDRGLDDYRWLIGSDAAAWLEEAALSQDSLVAQASRLRRDLSATRVHLVLEQVELRHRARAKFAAAQRMFFTSLALEQATDEATAQYKAARFPEKMDSADLCCGIGGDLLGLARRGPALGIERDEAKALLAAANLRALGFDAVGENASRVEIRDVADFDSAAVTAWHLDPDRRASGRRTVQLEHYEPNLATIERLLVRNGSAGIKLAPASSPLDDWTRRAELEWISRRGECKQMVAWFGGLAQTIGQRRATMVGDDGRALRTFVGRPDLEMASARDGVGRYLYEPDAAILAARLAGALAAEFEIAPIAPGAVYLTGDRSIDDPALDTFEVLETLPFRTKTVRDALRAHGIGRIEVKKRGVAHDPERLRRELAGPGERRGTVVVTRLGPRIVAIIARRLTQEAIAKPA